MPSFLSHKLKLIFCHIPRTGGTSFTKAIEPYLGFDVENDFPQHIPMSDFAIGRLGRYFDQYLKVSIWRDDRERFASLSIGAALAPQLIPKDDPYYWRTNEQWLNDHKNKNLADVLINFDRLPGSAVRFIQAITGIRVDEYPHLNKRDT